MFSKQGLVAEIHCRHSSAQYLSTTFGSILCSHLGTTVEYHTDLFWGIFLPLIMQVVPMWRINWFLCLWLLPVLLLCTIGYVWFHADIFLLWLHGLHLLCILLDAWDGWLPRCLVLCPPHIQIHQVRMRCLLKMKSSRVVPVFGATEKSKYRKG